MSLDSFVGFDGGEGMSEASFEAFKEKMKAAAAQIAQIKKEEGKQKKKEEELLKILLRFVKHSHKRDLVLLISRVLEKNLPANFVLAIVLLGNEDIQREVGKFLMVGMGTDHSAHSATDHSAHPSVHSAQPSDQPAQIAIDHSAHSTADHSAHSTADHSAHSTTGHSAHSTTGHSAHPATDHFAQPAATSTDQPERSLTFFDQSDDSLPLKLKIEIDNWIKNIMVQAEESPQKLLRTAYHIEMIEHESEFGESEFEEKREIHKELLQLTAFILRDFLEQHDTSEPYEKLFEFCHFILRGILNKTAENLENRKLLGN